MVETLEYKSGSDPAMMLGIFKFILYEHNTSTSFTGI